LLARRTLLLADDSPTVQKVVSLTFADEGVQVLTAPGGEEALAVLGEVVPDVLLADVHMPAPGGYELCARVKRDPRTAGVPVLLLVGTFEPFDEAEARACGADGVLTKPFQSIRELVNKVGGLIGGHSEQGGDAADARDAAAGVSAEATGAKAAARESTTRAAADVQPSPAFAGFGADDESIEIVQADDYLAAGRARALDTAAEFETAAAPLSREPAGGVGEVRNVEAAAGVVGPPSLGAAAGARAGRGYAAAQFNPPQAGAVYATRPARPTPDDSLLELGEQAPPPSLAAADLDDLILDIGDDDADEAPAEATGFGEVLASVDETAEAGGGPHAVAEISPVNLSSAWGDVPHLGAPPAPVAFAEVTPEGAPAFESVETRFDIEAETAGGAEPVTEAGGPATVDAQDAPPAPAWGAAPTQVAHYGVAETRADTAEASAGVAQLSPEMVDAVARRVVELMSDRAVRDIVWEVVPELSERLIRERLEKDNPGKS
jgi:CheY-like chemotaxis protein